MSKKGKKEAIPPLMTLKVGPERYQVHLKDSVYDGSQSMMGRCIFAKSEIEVSKEYEPRKRRNTLWHEAFHAVDQTYCIGLSEDQVRTLEVGLLALIDDNPDLLAWEGEAE